MNETTIDLKKHIATTYFDIRKGFAVLGIAFPFVLGIGGYILADIPLQHSMSKYYHTAMRDVFVGLLFFLGLFLYLYKGFTDFENYALNIAGVSVIMVALFPTKSSPIKSGSIFSLHGTFAILFFLFIGYVCIWRSSDTLCLIPNEKKKKYYKIIYRLMGSAMWAFPLLAFILSTVLQPHSEARSNIFFVEAFPVLVFGSYWFVKSIEIQKSDCQRHAMEGRLLVQYRWSDIFKPIRVKHIDHRQNDEHF